MEGLQILMLVAVAYTIGYFWGYHLGSKARRSRKRKGW